METVTAQMRAKCNRMIEGFGLFDSLSCNGRRAVGMTLEPKGSREGNTGTVMVVKSEMERIDPLRDRKLHQGSLQVSVCADVVPLKMAGNSKGRMSLRNSHRIGYFRGDGFAALGKT
jgi:hypothetical protein